MNQTPINKSIWQKFFILLGSIFIFSGISIYIYNEWQVMNTATHIAITFGTGMCLLLVALLTHNDPRCEPILSPLLILGTLFETIGLFVITNAIFYHGQDSHVVALVIFAALIGQQFCIFAKIKLSLLIFIMSILGSLFLIILLDFFRFTPYYIAIIIGISWITWAYYLSRTKYDVLVSMWYFVGAITLLAGVYAALYRSAFEWTFLIFCIAMIFLSLFLKSRALLFNSVSATILYLIYFTHQYFKLAVGWPLLLVLLGFVLWAVCIMGLKMDFLKRKIH